jgi:hypothetical protein
MHKQPSIQQLHVVCPSIGVRTKAHIFRYKQTVDTVLAFRDSKHTNVKQQVMLLIPKMSEFAPEKFVLSYLEPCTAHLLSVVANKSHAGSIAFQAFGQMISPLAGPTSCKELQRRLQPSLPDIEREISEALATKTNKEQAKRNACIEAIDCVGILAEVFSRFVWAIHADTSVGCLLPAKNSSVCACPFSSSHQP